MKHLKKFNEAGITYFTDWENLVKNEVMYAFMDLIDAGFAVETTQSHEYDFGYNSWIYIELYIPYASYIPGARFEYSKVKETLLFAIPYLMQKFELNDYKLIQKIYYPNQYDKDLGGIESIDDNYSLLKLHIKLQNQKLKQFNEGEDFEPKHKYKSESELIFNDLINWNILRDANDMSSDYFDEYQNSFLSVNIDYYINYDFYIKNGDINIYNACYRYKKINQDWRILYNYKDINNWLTYKIDPNKIEYNFWAIMREFEGDDGDSCYDDVLMKETYELQERLKGYYPDYNITDTVELNPRSGIYQYTRRKRNVR